MKEIDFLPEWYKSGKRREVSYRTQYIALSGVFIVMVVWNFITTHTISKAEAQFVKMENKQIQAEGISMELEELKSDLKNLQEKAETIERIDSRIDVANVLAELSFLIDEKIVLKNLEFIAQKFKDTQQASQSSQNTNVVRAVRKTLNEKKELPLGDVRFKVVINGVAADGENVAALICKLEDSPYFCQVVPSFSRNALITTANDSSFQPTTNNENTTNRVQRNGENVQVQVSEFEINAYLANYSKK